MDEKRNEIILFENQGVKLEVNLKDETVWLTQKQMAELFGKDRRTITRHIQNIYKDEENISKYLKKLEAENKVDEVLGDGNTINEALAYEKLNAKLSDLGSETNVDNYLLKIIYYNYYNPDENNTISFNEFVSFIKNDVITNSEYSSKFNNEIKEDLNTINSIMEASLNHTKYTKNEIFAILSKLADDLDKEQVDLLYVYYGSSKEYNSEWKLTVEQFVNYLNDDILQDSRFDDFIEDDMKQDILDAKDTITEAKDLLIGNSYSRVVINTKLESESDETFNFIQKIKDDIGSNLEEFYIIGDSPMAYEMSQTFQDELDFITILTMLAIFIVVAVTFKSIIIPLILILIIQCAVYMTMGILSFTGEKVYFIALLIVQSILMGATIDYAILYTTYYIEHRKNMNVKDSIINSYNKAIHTILTSASILIIVTLIVGKFASAIAAKICKTISQGTLCSSILILLLLPAVLAACDKIIIKKKS